jgi:nucleoside-diphosphate-sugar epimerase
MRIIIIGGSGFIGTRLAQRLSSTLNSFKIIDKIQSKFYPSYFKKGDVRHLKTLRPLISSKDNIIINLAAEHHDDVSPKSLYQDVNINGAINVCKIAREKGIKKIVFTSSVAVYGLSNIDIDESGLINPFNEYGRTKWEAEKVYRRWQDEDPKKRMLLILRPTVVFGEGNRGNVHNLLRQLVSGRFIMIGNGQNKKSLAYVENVAAFLEYAITFKSGLFIYNYSDKPDFSMNQLVFYINKILGKNPKVNFKLPYFIGIMIGKFFDLLSFILRRNFSISSIRIKKFCANSVYKSTAFNSDFKAPVDLGYAIKKTIKHEFLNH